MRTHIPEDISALKNTHLMDWLREGYGHCQNGSQDWCQGYLDSARLYIEALENWISALSPEFLSALDTSRTEAMRKALSPSDVYEILMRYYLAGPIFREELVKISREVADLVASTPNPGDADGRIINDPCVRKLAEDEPFFVLLGRDIDASHALSTWISYRLRREGPSDKTTAASRTLDEFRDYQDRVSSLREGEEA